jgi:hypothetical protein
MKKTLFISSLIAVTFFISFAASAQFGGIPAAVTDTFKARYPKAEKVTWKDKITVYVASFYMDNADQEARFSHKGEWQSTEKVMKQPDLPASVKDGLDKSKYYDWKVEDVFVRYIPSGLTQYHIVVSGSGLGKKNLLFSSEGRLIKDNSTL